MTGPTRPPEWPRRGQGPEILAQVVARVVRQLASMLATAT